MKPRPRHLKTPADKELYLELKDLVYQRMLELPRTRKNNLKFKLFLYPLVYSGLYLLALINSNSFGLYIFLYGLMGIMAVIIFCELIHELAHNNIFHKAYHNKIALKIFDLMGANSFLWQQRHLKLHHHFPNVNGWDADIEQKGPIAIFPHEQMNSITKHQHKYVFFLYPLFMLNWLLLRDFRDYYSKNRIVKKCILIPRKEHYKLIFFKSFYFFLILGIPIFFLNISIIQAISGLVILSISGSILAMVILLTPHVNCNNEFPKTDSEGNLALSWFQHQLISTNDINTSNWFTRNLMGNFNFHLIHHLFPKIPSVYAPELTEVLKVFCIKYDLQYKSYPLSTAVRKHYELIRKNAISLAELEL